MNRNETSEENKGKMKHFIKRIISKIFKPVESEKEKLLAKHILELQADKGRLTDENRELQETIGKLSEQLALRYDLEDKLANADYQLEGRDLEIKELKAQIEKMKKYGKLLQDICVVLGNDNFMVAVQLESVVKKLWDTSEEKEGLKMVEDIENRLLKIKPQEWAEINEWEIKEK